MSINCAIRSSDRLLAKHGVAQFHDNFCMFPLNNQKGYNLRNNNINGLGIKSPLISLLPMRFIGRLIFSVDSAAKVILKPIHEFYRGVSDANNGKVSLFSFIKHKGKVTFPIKDSSKICNFFGFIHAGNIA